MALSFDPNDWLMTLVILGSADIAHSDNKESGPRVFFLFSFRKQILKVYLICCVSVIFINSSYTMKTFSV